MFPGKDWEHGLRGVTASLRYLQTKVMTAVKALSLLALVIIIVQSWGLAFLYILGARATSLCLLVPKWVRAGPLPGVKATAKIGSKKAVLFSSTRYHCYSVCTDTSHLLASSLFKFSVSFSSCLCSSLPFLILVLQLSFYSAGSFLLHP